LVNKIYQYEKKKIEGCTSFSQYGGTDATVKCKCLFLLKKSVRATTAAPIFSIINYSLKNKIMNTKFALIILLIYSNSIFSQNIGIGTTNPSANAILDLTSSNKGLMLPRVNDTSSILTPTAGLLIYNQHTNSPNYYNGTSWRSFNISSVASNSDSVTYSISGGPAQNLVTMQQVTTNTFSGGSPGIPQFYDLFFVKLPDIHSNDLVKAVYTKVHFPYIEFKFYVQNTSTPYHSIKLTDCYVLSYAEYNNADGFYESYTLHPLRIGFKDWINTKSFSVTIATNVIGTY
jgi:type VI protein secretion system component Hcp